MSPNELKKAMEEILKDGTLTEEHRNIAKVMLDQLTTLQQQLMDTAKMCDKYDSSGQLMASHSLMDQMKAYMISAVTVMIGIGHVIWPDKIYFAPEETTT